MRPPKSTIWTTIFCTKEATKKHDPLHAGGHQKARSRPPFFTRRRPPKGNFFLHEGGHQKARSFAVRRPLWSQFFSTKEATKKNDYDCLHEQGNRKGRFFARRRPPKARSRPPFFARRRPPKSTIFCTKEATKKHDLDHHFLHEGGYQKARFCARRRPPKSTIFCTKAATKKHDFVHEGNHSKPSMLEMRRNLFTDCHS